MDATLKLSSNTLAYADLGATSNPVRRYVDWAVVRSYPVVNPKSLPYTVDPGASLVLFSGVRSTAVDGTTEFLLSPSPLAPSRYRLAWDAVGAAPALRADRALALSGHVVTMTAQTNLTLSMAATAGDFDAVVVGDTVLIPDTTTGDAASPFSPLNVGYWVVLAKDGTSTTLQLARPAGVGYSAVSETVTPGTNDQVQAFGAAGVQVGDKVTISAGFTAPVLGTYAILAVTDTYVEFVATVPLPTGVTAVPTAAGIAFYTGAKRYVRFEADQECVIRLNGDAGSADRLSPWVAGDADNTGFWEKCGPVWSATVVNLSAAPLNLLFISAE